MLIGAFKYKETSYKYKEILESEVDSTVKIYKKNVSPKGLGFKIKKFICSAFIS